ncbi:hypothetical protein BD410DRAFT_108957 [Rickenella mellea]|uniref:Uncharacterized protein n=1 Tax=Rickenella mellea TaxID=50990 RepID=A0A4Y7Q8Y4_9AGAM|nr:hypothetical protein BD410DRAFT_108957 [Rickenella mellea]
MLEAFVSFPRHANLPGTRCVRPLSFLRRLRGQPKWPYDSQRMRETSSTDQKPTTPNVRSPPRVSSPQELPAQHQTPNRNAPGAAAVNHASVKPPPTPYIYDEAAWMKHNDEVFIAQFRRMQLRGCDKRALTRCWATVQGAHLDTPERVKAHAERDANRRRLLDASQKCRLSDLKWRRRERMKMRAEQKRLRNADAIRKQRERVDAMRRNPLTCPPSNGNPASSPRRPRLPLSPPTTPLKGPKSPIAIRSS